MAETPESSGPVLSQSKERWFVWVLCLLSVIHLLVFSAAFPFFNVDEVFHFDLVEKYSRLDIPQHPDFLAEESLQYIVVFSTWEYVRTNDTLLAPPWKQPLAQMEPILLSREKRWQLANYESVQPPLYYSLAGAWWRLWGALGFHDGYRLYLLRFFNALIAGALVWTGWHAARLVFPQKFFIRIAVPAVLACMPDRTMYFVGNDVLSPLCFGVAFVLLIQFLHFAVPPKAPAAAIGLLLAAAFLAKSSNLPVLAVAGMLITLKSILLVKQGNLRASLPALAWLLVCAALPMAAWMAWCKLHFGTYTGTTGIARTLGWTVKPFSQWWNHPIFTPHGFWMFLLGNLATLWQGEMLWHYQPLSLGPVNLVYTLVSVVLLAMAVFYLKKTDSSQRPVLLFALAALVAELAFFGFLSIVYDFHDCFYPSRASPFFVSGRLLLGALVPFVLLFAFGLDCALGRLGRTMKCLVLALLLGFMLGSEIATDWPVFPSQYNLFDM